MNKLIICTTAICRKSIHDICFSLLNNELLKYENTVDIHMIVNVDKIEQLSETQEETVANIDRLITAKIKKYWICPEKPSHPQAVRNIYNFIYDNNMITDETVILWLEDDWKLLKPLDLNFLFRYMRPTVTISLVAHSYFGFRPSFIGSYIFKRMFSNINDDYDGEVQSYRNIYSYLLRKNELTLIYLFSSYNQWYLNKLINYDRHKLIGELIKVCLTDDDYDSIIIQKINDNKIVAIFFDVNIFIDIGRKWMQTTNLRKWSKEKISNITYEINI